MATNNATNYATGAVGTVLTGNGVGVTPTFQAASTGNVTGPGSSTDNALVRWDGTGGTVIQNGVITEDDTGNLSVVASVSGASLSTTVSNTSNTASATAFYDAKVAGATADDAYYKAEINAGQAWSFGLDNSDSDSFVISSNATLGTTNVMRVQTTGEINYPLQSAFLALNSAGSTDVTGDGTVATIVFDTKIFDQNSDFASNTFTAPVTGRYQLNALIRMEGILSTHTNGLYKILTSNRSYPNQFSPSKTFDNNTDLSVISAQLADMDAADTATVTLQISNGTKVVDITGGTSPAWTTFGGHLAC